MRVERFTAALSIIVVLVLIVAGPASAFVPRAGSTVVVSEPVQDDLYVAGGTVEVPADVDGDIVAAGGTLTLSGPVTGSILAAGGSVSIRGTVGRSIRAAAGTLTLGAPVGTDAVLVGGNVSIDRGAEIGRDLVTTGGNMHVTGTVRRNAWLTGGTLTIGGTIEGNLEAHVDRVVLLPTARVAGTLRYSAEEPIEVQPGAQVAGELSRVDRPSRYRVMVDPAARLRLRFAGRILEALWLLALGLVLAAVTPRGVRAVAERVRTQFGLSLLAGFILMVVVPVAVIVFFITVVGIPIALVLLLLYFTTLYPAQVFVSAWLGEAIARRFGRTAGTSPYLAMTLGVIVLVILVGLPFVGWIFRLLALCVGFGALWAAIWGARTRRLAAPA